VRCASIDSGGEGTVGDFLDNLPPGAVVVIDNDGRTDMTVWGGIMTEVAAARGIAGTVINGVCRDASAGLSQNYPLFSRGRFMRTGKDRVRLIAVGAPVTIPRNEIRPGDLVCADADGRRPGRRSGRDRRCCRAHRAGRGSHRGRRAQAARCAQPASSTGQRYDTGV
jgi:regulator of RNase E activity RraA